MARVLPQTVEVTTINGSKALVNVEHVVTATEIKDGTILLFSNSGQLQIRETYSQVAKWVGR